MLLLAVACSSPFDSHGAEAAAADDACVKLVSYYYTQWFEHSSYQELKTQFSAHRAMASMLDALGRQRNLGPSWHEGNPFWEEAYTILYPELLALNKAQLERLRRYDEANLPGKLDPGICRKHWALLNSKYGSIAGRIQMALVAQSALARIEKPFPVPARLHPIVEKVREQIRSEMALIDDPEVRGHEALYRKTYEDLRAYDLRFGEGVSKSGRPYGPEEEKAAFEAGAEMMRRHQGELVSIRRRFQSANAK